MSNTLLTMSMITKEALVVLENELTFSKYVNRKYDDSFAKGGAKIGYTLNVRKPVRYVGTSGPALNIEDTTETSIPVTLTTQFHVDTAFTSADLTVSMDDFSERILVPAVAEIANKIDYDGLQLYNEVFNTVGTPGTTPNSLLTYLQSQAKMNFEAAPKAPMRSMVIGPTEEVTIVDALKGLFHATTEIESQYKEGTMGLVAGARWSMDQNIAMHTIGPLGGTPLVNGASQTGSSLITDGWTASAASRLKKGDVFTLAGVYAVNPKNRQSTGQLRQFVVTADTSSDGSGNATIPIYPPITPPVSGNPTAYQTVTASPADNAALTIFGAANTVTSQSLLFHRDAFTLVSADLEMPGGVDMASRQSNKNLGISMRLVRAYDITNDRFPMRIDVLYGWKCIRPELACRIAG